MTSHLSTSKEDQDRQMGAPAIEQEMRQFEYLQHLPDDELAHRMAKTKPEVRSLRKHFGPRSATLKTVGINYRIRLLLGKHGIGTLAKLHATSYADLRAIEGLGPQTLREIKNALETFYHG